MRGWLVVLIPLVILVGALVWLRVARYREEIRIQRWLERSPTRSDATADDPPR